MKLSPQQAPLYGECVLTVQLCDDECGEEEEEVEFYLLFAGSTQRHLASTLRLSQVTLQAICPAHDSCEVVQVTLCSARPSGSVDALAEECFQFVQDLAWDMAQFLVSRAGGGGGSSSQEGALLLDECQIPAQECERLDSNLALALRHLQLPHGWSVLDTKIGAHMGTQLDAPRSIEDHPHISTGLDGGQPDTLLHFAARRGLCQVALFLLEQPGGREALRHPNQNGRTPTREAQKNGHAQLQKLLSDQEELSSEAQKAKDCHVYPGGRGCLRHHPELSTYTLTHRVPPGNPPPTLQKEVQEFQRLIRRHRDGEGETELQQRLEKLYPATGNDDSRPGKGRPNGSSRRTPKRKRGKRNNNSSIETQRTTDASPEHPGTADTKPEPTANHVSAAARRLCPNGERAGERAEEGRRAGPAGEPSADVEEGCGAAAYGSRTGRQAPQTCDDRTSPAEQIEEAGREEHTVPDTSPEPASLRRSPPSPPPPPPSPTAAAAQQPKQEERSQGEEESTAADFTMGNAQTQDQQQQQKQQQQHRGAGEMTEGGRGNQGGGVLLGDAGEPETSDTLMAQETEMDSAAATQPSLLIPAALNNGHQEDRSMWGDASTGEDISHGSHSGRADSEGPEEKEMAVEERAETWPDLADTPRERAARGSETPPAEDSTERGEELTRAVEEGEIGEELGHRAGQRSERGEELSEEETENGTQCHATGSPSRQQETDWTASLSEEHSLSEDHTLSTEPSPETDSDCASTHTHSHAISDQGHPLSDDNSTHTNTDSSLKEMCSTQVEEQLDLTVSLRPGMAPGPGHLPEPGGTSWAPASSEACGYGQEQGCDAAVSTLLSGVMEELSYAAVVKRSLTSDQEQTEEEVEEEVEERKQQGNSEEEKSTVPEESPLLPAPSGEVTTVPQPEPGDHIEQDTHDTQAGVESFTDSEPHTPAGAELTHVEPDNTAGTESTSHTAPETETEQRAEGGKVDREEQTTVMIPGGTNSETQSVQSEGTVPENHTVQSEGTVPETFTAQSEGTSSLMDTTQSEGAHLHTQTVQTEEAVLEMHTAQSEGNNSLADPMQKVERAAALPSTEEEEEEEEEEEGTEAPQAHTDLTQDADSRAEVSSEPLSVPLWEGPDALTESQADAQSPEEEMEGDGQESAGDTEHQRSPGFGEGPQGSEEDGQPTRSTGGSDKGCVQVAVVTALERASEGAESPDRSAKGNGDSEGEDVCSETIARTLAADLLSEPPTETSSSIKGPAVEPCPEELTTAGDAHTVASCLTDSERGVDDACTNTDLNETDTHTDTKQSKVETCVHITQSQTETDTHTILNEMECLTHASQSETETHRHTNVNETEVCAHMTQSGTDTHTHLVFQEILANTHTCQSDPQVYTQLNPSGLEPAADAAGPHREAQTGSSILPNCSVNVDLGYGPGLQSDATVKVCPYSSQEVIEEWDTHLRLQCELETHTQLERDTLPETGAHLETHSTPGADVVDTGLVNTLDGSEEPTPMTITDEIHRQAEVFYAVDSCPETDSQKSNKECFDVSMFPATEKVSVESDVQTHSLAEGDKDVDTVSKAEMLAPAVDGTSEVPLTPPSKEEAPSTHPSDPSDARASWSSTESWQALGAAPAEVEESERKDRVTEVPARSALLRPAMRPLSPFRRHSWGPGKGPASEAEPNTCSPSVRSPGGGKTTKTTGHRRSVSWCPSDILRPALEEIGNRSSSLEGLSAEQEESAAPAVGVVSETGRCRDIVRGERGRSLVSLTEEEQETDMVDCSSLEIKKSVGLLRNLNRPPPHTLTKSRSMVAISPKDFDAMGRVQPKRRISFSFSISPLLPKSKTHFSIGSSSSDEEEAVSLASYSSASGSLEYSISEEDPGPLRSDGEGRPGTKVSRTFSYLKSKMSKKNKGRSLKIRATDRTVEEKDKEKERLREREKDAKEKEKASSNGHVFSAITNAPSTPCQHCSKPLNTKEALICNNCSTHVHKGCRENLPVCAKVKMKQLMAPPDSALLHGVTMRNKTVASLSRDRPKSTFTIPDDQTPANPPRKSPSSIMSFSGHIPLSKSVSISNIAGPVHDDMPLRRFLSQSTDSLHKTSKVNESTESLTDEGTETDSHLLCEFEADMRELEADSWSATVDKKQLKQIKKDVVKRQDVIYELMQTEFHQVRTLRIMAEVYYKGLSRELQVEGAALERLFPCLDELADLHTHLLSSLMERRSQTPLTRDATAADRGFLVHRIGDVLVSQFSGSHGEHMKKVYGRFCSRHNEAVNYYKELHAKDKRFQAFIKKKMSSAIVRRLSIPECILLVTQRITKYPVLIQRILQHTKDGDEEHEEVSRALRLVKEVITAVDNCVHDYEKKRRLKDVHSRTDSKSIMCMKSGQMFAREDLMRGRRLHHDGPLQLKTSAGRFKDVQALLLSDVLVFLQEKDQKYVFASLDQRSTVISLHKLIVREVANEEKALFLITAGSLPEMVEVYASSKDERKSWTQLIQNAMQNIEKDEDEGIPSESEEDKRLQESKAKEMRDLLHHKDEQILGLLEDKVKLFRELCDCATPDDLIQTLRGRMMFRATPRDVTKGEPIMKDALKEVETLQELVNRSVGGAVGHQMSSCQGPPGGSVGPVCLPRRAETFGGFDSHQMNISKNGEKDEGEDLRRTESDSVLKKGGNANPLLLKRNSEQVLNSVSHLNDLLLSLQAVVVQQDSFIEDQRQALTQRSSSFSSSSSVCSSASFRPTVSLGPPTPTPTTSSSAGVAEVGVSASALAEQERALAEERRRWQWQVEERERGLAEREQRARRQEEEAATGGRQLEQETRQLREREEELQRSLQLLRDQEEEVQREREKLRDAQACLERDREQLLQHTQDQLCRPHRTPSTTSEDSMKFQSSGSLDRIHGVDGDLSCYSTSPATASAAKDLMSRMDSKKRKGKNLNPFSSSSSSTSSAPAPQMPSRLLQLTKPKDKKDKKKKKGQPTDTPSTEAPDAPAYGEVFFC